jgi:hypothetical protein
MGLGLLAAPILSAIDAPLASGVGPQAVVNSVTPVSGVQGGGSAITVTGSNLGATGTTTVDVGGTHAATSVVVNASGTSLTANVPVNPNVGVGTAYGSTFDVTVNNGNGSPPSATGKQDRYTYEYSTNVCGPSGTASCAATITAQETSPVTGSVITGTAGGVDLLQVPLNATVTLISSIPGNTGPGSGFSDSTLDVSTTPPTIESNTHPNTGTTDTAVVPDPTPGSPYLARFVAEADHCPMPPTFPSPPTTSGGFNCGLTPTGGNSDPVVVEWGNPTVTGVSPAAGSTAGGTSVTITGTGLTGVTSVNFGSTAATGVNVNSDTSVTATSPAGAAGTVDVVVQNAAGFSPTSAADQFTYTNGPTVTAVSPDSGPVAGGTSVTVTGANLTGATAVNFGTTAGTNVVVNGGGTSLTVTSPAGSLGTVDVTVVTTGGTSPTSAADKFTYHSGGYWMVGSDGGIFSFGGAPFFGSLPALNIHVKNVVSIVPTHDGLGYWMIGSDGGVFAFGDAGFVGSIPGLHIHINNIVGAVPTATGKGYWMIGSDGGVFAFGDATFVGSIPGLGISVKNIVAVVPTHDNKGYWMIGSDGGVFAFGDATFVGSIPGLNIHINNIVGAVPTSSGRGYWMAGSDGGVFAFSAPFVGSIPGLNIHINNIVGVVATGDNQGYWMVGNDGGVFAFGDAGFVGSVPGDGIHVTDVVAFAPQ